MSEAVHAGRDGHRRSLEAATVSATHRLGARDDRDAEDHDDQPRGRRRAQEVALEGLDGNGDGRTRNVKEKTRALVQWLRAT
jgi:hypothetical protein